MNIICEKNINVNNEQSVDKNAYFVLEFTVICVDRDYDAHMYICISSDKFAYSFIQPFICIYVFIYYLFI